MFGALFTKVSDALGKTYLFSGLLPSAVFLAGYAWYFSGPGGAAHVLDSLDLKQHPADAVWIVVVWAVLGLILFAIRAPVFALFEELPSGWIGRLLIRIQLGRRDRFERRKEELEWKITVMHWYERNFAEDVYIPAWAKLPEPDDAAHASALARQRVADVVAKRGMRPSPESSKVIQASLVKLYLAAGTSDASIKRELGRWRRALVTGGVAPILKVMTEDAYRQWVCAKAKSDRFAKGEWIHPTALGNRIFALDDHCAQRYRMEASALWSRLWWVLPSAAKREITDVRLSAETLMNLALVLLAVGIAPPAFDFAECHRTVTLFGQSCAASWMGSFAVGGVVLAYLSYRGSVLAMDVLARKMETLIDVHRLRLLVSLGYRPETVADECALLEMLRTFFVGGAPRPAATKLSMPSQKSPDNSSDESEEQSSSRRKKTSAESSDEQEEQHSEAS